MKVIINIQKWGVKLQKSTKHKVIDYQRSCWHCEFSPSLLICEIVGILMRVCRFKASVLAECKRLDNCGNVSRVSCNCLNRKLSDDDVDDDDDDVLSLFSKMLTRWLKCSTARSMLVSAVLAARVTSVTAVDKLLARSLKLSLKHTHHQHQQLLLLPFFSFHHNTV